MYAFVATATSAKDFMWGYKCKSNNAKQPQPIVKQLLMAQLLHAPHNFEPQPF
jgi:hypothetical protein